MSMLRTVIRHPVMQLCLVMFLAYLPASTFFLALKNDFFFSYFPAKFFVSESLAAGELPVWNPFLNYGLPTFGDLSLSYWNPTTWIFGLIGYNAYTFTLEALLYMLSGGIGMYLLAGIWTRLPGPRSWAAIAYMCSGFVTAHLQHFNWINASGLLPFCLFFYWKWLKEARMANLLGSIFFFSLFSTAAHPGFTIGGLYFFGIITAFIILNEKNKWPVVYRTAGMLAMLAPLVAAPAWGALQVLPFTNRSGAIVPDFSNGATGISSWISFLMPFPSTSTTSWLNNDMSLRNCFIGLIPLAMLPFALHKRKQNCPAAFFLVLGLAFLILSSPLSGPVYSHLPLIRYVRLPGEFRLFSLLSLIISTLILLNNPDARRSMTRYMKYISWGYIIASILAMAWIMAKRDSVVFSSVHTGGGSLQTLKQIVDGLSFADKVLLQAPVLGLLAYAYTKFFSAGSERGFITIVAMEFIFASLLNVPYTGVGKRTVADIESMISMSPAGVQAPYHEPEKFLLQGYPATDSVLNVWPIYGKQPAAPQQILYPLVLESSGRYFASGEHNRLLEKPFAFLEGTGSLSAVSNTYKRFDFEVNGTTADTITIKQAFTQGWKAELDGEEVPVLQRHQGLIAAGLPPGNHKISFSYDRKEAGLLLAVHMLLLTVTGVLLCRYLIRYIFP